jgi:hypothetical protein
LSVVGWVVFYQWWWKLMNDHYFHHLSQYNFSHLKKYLHWYTCFFFGHQKLHVLSFMWKCLRSISRNNFLFIICVLVNCGIMLGCQMHVQFFYYVMNIWNLLIDRFQLLQHKNGMSLDYVITNSC